MAKVRNISNETLELRYAGAVLGTAAPDAVLELTDGIFNDLAWPESLWQVVSGPKQAFDPNEHTVAQVVAHLDKADDDERARVLAAERDGKARAGVLATNDEQES